MPTIDSICLKNTDNIKYQKNDNYYNEVISKRFYNQILQTEKAF